MESTIGVSTMNQSKNEPDIESIYKNKDTKEFNNNNSEGKNNTIKIYL